MIRRALIEMLGEKPGSVLEMARLLPLEQEKNMQALRFLLDHDDQFHLKDEYISFVKGTD